MSDWPSNKPQYVSALPGSPYDGQEIYYIADSTNGVIWHLRYNGSSASAYKWEFVGGSELFATVDTAETRASTVYGDLATVGPSITAPLAGDYMVTVSTYLYNSTTAGAAVYMSYAVGAVVASDTDACRYDVALANTDAVQTFRTQRKTGLAASTAIVAKYKTAPSGTGVYRNRFLAVTPVRVG